MSELPMPASNATRSPSARNKTERKIMKYATHANFGRNSVQQFFPALSDPNHQTYRVLLDNLKQTHSQLPPLYSSFDSFKDYMRQVYFLENRLITLHQMSSTLSRFCPKLVEHQAECKRAHYKTYSMSFPPSISIHSVFSGFPTNEECQ